MTVRIFALCGLCLLSFVIHTTEDDLKLLQAIKKQRELRDIQEKFEQMKIEEDEERINTELIPLIITLDPVIGERRELLCSRNIIKMSSTDQRQG